MNQDTGTNEASELLIALGAQLHAEELTWGSSGNLSIRTSRGISMTASGSRLSRLQEGDLIGLDLEGNAVGAASGRKPSKEYKMHLAVYRQQPGAGAVIHTSPPYTTFLACTDLKLPSNAFPEGMMQLQQVARVPYQHAGSKALADAVESACKDAMVMILENHGALVWAETVDDALLKLQVLEFAARLAYLQGAASVSLRQLPTNLVEEFRESGYKR